MIQAVMQWLLAMVALVVVDRVFRFVCPNMEYTVSVERRCPLSSTQCARKKSQEEREDTQLI
jgi:hypothetical protein